MESSVFDRDWSVLRKNLDASHSWLASVVSAFESVVTCLEELDPV